MKLRVHAHRLAKYNDMMEMDVRTMRNTEEGQENHEYEVEEVMDDTGSRKQGKRQYLVRWKDYGPEHGSWASMEDMVHCTEKVQAYELNFKR